MNNATAEEWGSYLLLSLGNELHALDSVHIREVTRWRTPTSVPGAPPILPGIISHRGAVVPIIDLRRLLGMPDATPGRTTRYLIVYHDDTALALLVDAVIDLINISDTTREALPSTLNPQHARLLETLIRWNDRPVALLNLAEIVAAVRGGN